jgi:hypothetical protein
MSGGHDRRGQAREQNDGVPITTWVVGSAALVVVLTAGALFLGEKPKDQEEEARAEPTPDEPEAPDPVRELAPKNPLELSSTFLDAQQRAKVWSLKAMLSGVDLVIENGAPTGPITFEFGQTIGPAVPKAPMSPKRQTLEYRGDDVQVKNLDSSQARVGLPDPNCPLDVAFRKLSEGGVSTAGRVAVVYTYSQKHNRPVWLMTNEAGQATSINADTCALLLR